ncbi:MAG TPA: disulfide bond formation protein B [Stellaceae bacterium]|nr:disulfide bond formation protein B [Stellaceae bacterium]
MNSFRIPLILVLAASIVVVGTALLSQYWGGLVPCELCLYERWFYYAAIVLALAALACPAGGGQRAALALLGVVFLASTALGFYHTGVEQHWFAGPSACTSSGSAAETLEQFKARLLGQRPVMCDEIQWSIAGLSLAALNAICSLAIAVFAFWSARKRT